MAYVARLSCAPQTPLSGMNSVSVDETYSLYFMYKSDEPGSIWVTLGKLDWGWKGAAKTDTNGVWSLDPAFPADSSHDPAGVDSTELPPQWSTNIIAAMNPPQ